MREDVLSSDLDMDTWAYLLGKPNKNSIPIFFFREPHERFIKEIRKDRLEPYREQALELKQLFEKYTKDKKLLKIIDKQCVDAIFDMAMSE